MIYRTSPFIALICALALAANADAARRSRQKAEPPPAPPQFKVDGPTRTMSIERLAIAVPVGSVIGQYRRGCIYGAAAGGDPMYSENAFRGVPQTEFFSAFLAEAGAAGYSLASEQSGDLFNTESKKAELVVGAGITAIKAFTCDNSFLSPAFNVEAEMTVDWQVFDPLEKKILFRATNVGIGKVVLKDNSLTMAVDGARAAFRAAAKNILADPNFVAVLRDPRGNAPAAQAPAPASSYQIARLPLSAADFRSQVNALRNQVVTIVTPQGSGSGFYISSDLLLTNHHVIAGYTDVRINFFGGRQIPGTVIAGDARRDIALVRTEVQMFAGLPLRVENPDVASPVFVIGSPLDPKNEGSVSSGIVSGFRDHEYGPMLQSDVGVTFGNSGGPMFDDKGNVIALTDLGIPDSSGNTTQVNLFIPIGDGLKKLNIEFGAVPATAQK